MISTEGLKGKTALVTGGGRGIGQAITRLLAEAGANVVIASRKLENLSATADALKGLSGRVVPIACHIGRLDQLENLVSRTEAELGPVDVLVNNGATALGQGPALAATDEMFDKIVDINVKSAFRLVRLTVPKMIARGGGSVINIASISGLQPQHQGLLYSFTKAGLIMLTRSWAGEFGPHGVRVNAIAPGLIQTEMSEFYWKDEHKRRHFEQSLPIGRIGQPEDIARAVVYLACDASSFMTGQVMVIDGGATACPQM
ncbi:MAG TPA: SDR family oxidoreductase [Pirellulales bacterium]|nr:SDR family oxidoreductase [Pirellulales bacterium]